MKQTYFRIYQYAVTYTQSSVIYFGGLDNQSPNDRVAEYKDLKWTLIGSLASSRYGHRSIKIDNKIYLFGGEWRK